MLVKLWTLRGKRMTKKSNPGFLIFLFFEVREGVEGGDMADQGNCWL